MMPEGPQVTLEGVRPLNGGQHRPRIECNQPEGLNASKANKAELSKGAATRCNANAHRTSDVQWHSTTARLVIAAQCEVHMLLT